MNVQNDMGFSELKRLWQENARQLAASLRLNAMLMQRANLGKVETTLGRLARAIAFELVLILAGIVLVGWFGAHNPQPKFLVPAAMIDLYAVAMVVANARQLAVLKSIDYDEPVVAIQQRVEALKLLRIRTTLGALLFGPLMWLPFFIVGVRLLFGGDVYAAAGPEWLIANALFGLAVIPMAILLARIAAPRLHRSGALRRLADDVAGRSLASALHDLAALRRFADH